MSVLLIDMEGTTDALVEPVVCTSKKCSIVEGKDVGPCLERSLAGCEERVCLDERMGGSCARSDRMTSVESRVSIVESE